MAAAKAAGGGYVLDGIPRNMRQARAAYLIDRELEMTADVALHLQADDAELTRRLLARAALEHRSGDTAGIIGPRLAVDAMRSAQQVGREILAALPGWARDRGSVGCGAPGRPRLTARHFPQCHLVGEALDEDRAPQEEFVHGGDRSPSCGTSAPVGVPFGEGDSPSRSSMSQAIFQHRVAGGRGCHGEACP